MYLIFLLDTQHAIVAFDPHPFIVALFIPTTIYTGSDLDIEENFMLTLLLFALAHTTTIGNVPVREYPAKVLKCYDADTCKVAVDLGLGLSMRIRLRLYGINAPEMRGPEKAAGTISRDWLRSQIVGKMIRLMLVQKRDGTDAKGKYGRWIAFIFKGDTSLNDKLVELGYAKKASY